VINQDDIDEEYGMKRSQSFEKKQADKLFSINQKYEMVRI
jgi:hypothetical protein